MKRLVFLLALAVAGLAATYPATAQSAPAGNAATDVLAAHLNTQVSPGVDFFEYANGGWLAQNPIPSSETSWGIARVIQNETYVRLRKLSEEAAAANAAHGTESQKIGDFWSTALDSGGADRLGLAPLRAELDRIDAAHDVNGILDAAFAGVPLREGAFFSLYIGQDAKNSDVIAVQLDQGGLGLPDRDYYFNTDSNSVRVRADYAKHLQKMLTLIDPGAASRPTAGADVMQFETRLAKVSRQIADLRDPEKNYHKMSVPEAVKLTPSIAWGPRLQALGLANVEYVIIGQPEFFTALETELRNTPIPVLQDYLRFQLVSTYAEYLGRSLEDQDFAFYHQSLSGQQEQLPRWKRALDAEESALGMVLGKLYVKAYFSEKSKARYSDMVEQIRSAYRARIQKLAWMSEVTRRKALEKLDKVGKKVGYPDQWKDYSALEIGRDSWAANMMAASRWRFQDRVSKFGKPVDRSEWHMTPQTYNAYYSSSNNEIVLPAAAFLIPGMADEDADDAVVYGYAAASTIGHEITHGFDDEGRQFDPHGNLHSWWTKADEERFNKRAEVMVKEFDAFEPLPGMHINGKAALGENIADLGGVVLGIDAFKKTEQYRKGETIAGLTPMQRFFLGYALSWLSEIRKENLARHLLSDVHSPAKWRVIGPLVNVPEFYEAFGVKPGQPMYRTPAQRVSIW